jgi:hypothetical protein
MSVPPDKMMDLIRKQQPASAAPAGADAAPPLAPGMSDSSTAPMAAPMSTPEPKMGNKEGALVNISMAMDLIEQALPSLGSESEEGQKALAAIRSLTGLIGPRKGKTNELQQSEIMQMLQNLPQAGGATPEGRAMAQAPAIPNLPPMPGAASPMAVPGAGGAGASPTPTPM